MMQSRFGVVRLAGLILSAVLVACAPRGADPVPVAGGNSPPMPPLPAAEAHIEPAALEAAGIAARDAGADALLIVRNSHVLFERYWHGTNFATPIEAGPWQVLIDDLLAGAVVADRHAIDPGATPTRALIEQATGMGYAAYLSKRLWRPIGANDAELAPGLRVAQGDWIRIGELLANDGLYMGEEVAPRGWVQRVLARNAVPADAAYPAPTRDARLLLGPGGASLWVVPSLRLVILRTGGATGAGRAAADARIADFVIRGVTDRPDPATLVPAH